MEEWKDIEGYEGRYAITKDGRVWSYPKKTSKSHIGRFLKPQNSDGYFWVCLWGVSGEKRHKVHRLVAEIFIPNPYGKKEVNHINGIKTDNRVENLEWCTASENRQHAWDTGLLRITRNNNFLYSHPAKGKFGKHSYSAKPILQYDLQGNFIKEWGAIIDASRELNIYSGGIVMACNGNRNRKTANGFIWKYKY